MLAVALFCIACAAYWRWRRNSAKTTEPPYLPWAWPVLGHLTLFVGDACDSTMLAVVLLCIACAAYWWWRRNSAKATEPPYIPEAWPIVGHAPLFIGDGCNLWNQFNNVANHSYDLGGVISGRLGPRTVYFVSDPDDCFTVASTCLEKDPFYDIIKPWVGDGLITARYAIWKNHRKLLNPAFNQVLLDSFMGVFNSQSRKLVKNLEKNVGKGLFDHWTYTRHNSLETICLTSLGVDFTDSNLNSEYMDATEQVFNTFVERFTKFWWHSPYTFAWSKLKKEQDSYLKILHNMSKTVLRKRKNDFKGNTCAERSIIPGTRFKAFIDILLEQSIENGVFNDKEIRDHVDTMLAAGHETTANVLMFTLVLLGSYPEAQEKLYTEIKEVLGEDRDVEKTDLSKLVYLEAVLKESMRVFTIAPIIARKLDRDVKLKNYTLLAGRTCALFLSGLHKHPMWGSDRNEFKPERWLEPGKLPDTPNAFAAFSLGRRNCIGKVYAMMSMKTTLAHVVRSYRIQADHTKIRIKYAVVLKPDNEGYYISIERRT